MPLMKIRHPWLITILAFAGAWLIRLWIGTLRYRYHGLGPEIRPGHPKTRQRYIYAFWHENLLVLARHYAYRDVFVLISQHADGQLIAEICRWLGFSLVRGSTTRGGVEAMRRMVRLSNDGHIAITPDGPRGPRRHVQPGLIYLAAQTGLPIVTGGVGYRRPWRTSSWDRFALPRPGSVARCVASSPIPIPPDLNRDQFEHYRKLVEDSLGEMTDLAERWADMGGRLPPERRAAVKPWRLTG
jgi:lysophospholipid acyltransferase (LPLAT)-like uncharacterized protein